MLMVIIFYGIISCFKVVNSFIMVVKWDEVYKSNLKYLKDYLKSYVLVVVVEVGVW